MSNFLYLVTFIGGMVSLALELAAGRLLAPAFGTSELVWSAIIGMILLYFAIGYVVGGRWADRSPQPKTLYTILLAASVTIALIPLISRPALTLAARGMAALNAFQVGGPLLAVLILFIAPVTLLACVSPFVIRLAMTDLGAAGMTSGKIYALSTLGSFVGTFLPNLVLIPALGTRRTFLLLALITLLPGIVGLWRSARRRALVGVLLALAIVLLACTDTGPIKPQARLIYEEESTYNYIQVLEGEQGTRFLLLNEGQGIHSVYNPKTLLTGGTWDYFLIAPYFNPPPQTPEQVRRLLVIGSAAGTIPKQYTAIYGPIPIDGVEIDPAIVRVGRDYFDMTEPNLHVAEMDGRTFLARTTARYDVVAVDAYRLPYIPWHLTTVEFFQEIRQVLTERGVVAINAGHTPDDWRIVEALVATLKQSYPSVHVIAVPDTFNAIIVATVQETSAEDFDVNRRLLQDPLLARVAERAAANLVTVAPGGMVFTDDRAPVELLTDVLVLRYVLGTP
ncbi:MAG TPA: fused MFS/spermidine synthase [Anaerolineae bacterium]|nr:fused MFS/spermidine synthase [Anaerolineae bacterium]